MNSAQIQYLKKYLSRSLGSKPDAKAHELYDEAVKHLGKSDVGCGIGGPFADILESDFDDVKYLLDGLNESAADFILQSVKKYMIRYCVACAHLYAQEFSFASQEDYEDSVGQRVLTNCPWWDELLPKEEDWEDDDPDWN